MAKQKIKTRVQNKHDVADNWSKATSFIPLAGELIIYDADSTYSYKRFKIGDGVLQSDGTVTGTPVNDLPFLHTLRSDGDITVNATTGAVTVKDDSHTHDGRYYTESEINTKLSSVNASLESLDANKAPKSHGIHYIEGGGTTVEDVATWTGTHSDITEYFAGLTLAFKIGTAGSMHTTLNINNLGAVSVVKNATTDISTSFPVSSVIFLVYTIDSDGTAYWKAHDYYANSDKKTSSSNKAATKLYVVGATSQSSSGVTTYSNKNIYIGTDNRLYDAEGLVASDADLAAHTHIPTTASAAPQDHTHKVTVSGTTGSNSGTAVNAVTGYSSFSGGAGSLDSDTTSTNGIKYVEAVSHTAASLTGTKTFNTDAIKKVTLEASTTSTDGPAYVESVTHTAASLGGTKTFNTNAIKSVTLSASATSSDGPVYVESISGGSGSLTSDTTAANGIQYVETQGTFTAGTTPVSNATPTHTSTASGSSSGTSGTIASYSAGVLTIASTVNSGVHTHTYDKTTGITLTRGTAPSMGGATTKYLHHGHTAASATTKYMKATGTAASTGTVTISGGSITPVTKYMKATGTAASTGTVGISGGSTSTTTKYLHHTHTGAALGSPSTSAVAPSGHTHSYGSSTALTTEKNSGDAVAAVTDVGTANY